MEYQKRINGNHPIKIIAATATINDDFHVQIKHLYGRAKAVRFPSSGPDRKKSFYADYQNYNQIMYYKLKTSVQH